MLRKIWFQLHWLLGITAGIVLAVIGLTGAVLSFQQDILHWMNPEIISVNPVGASLMSPAALVKQIQNSNPDKKIVSLTLQSDPLYAAQVGFASTTGERHGEHRYVNPYTGDLMEIPKGEHFFEVTEEIHRWLAAGEIGKQIVGASTLALVVLCLSGLYLRWPPLRRMLDWRIWFTVNTALRGRGFLWNLHAVAGTWALLFYLLAGLTGLYWSYDWYRNGLFALTGTPQPAFRGAPRGQGQNADHNEASVTLMPVIDLDSAWQAFQQEAGQYSMVTMRIPDQSGQPLQIMYLDAEPPHERAFNRITVNPVNGVVQHSERYSEKPAGAKLMSSILPLHSGSYFGLPGIVLMMLASLMMPLFMITGWMLYLDRRKRKRETGTMRANSIMQDAVPQTE